MKALMTVKVPTGVNVQTGAKEEEFEVRRIIIVVGDTEFRISSDGTGLVVNKSNHKKGDDQINLVPRSANQVTVL